MTLLPDWRLVLVDGSLESDKVRIRVSSALRYTWRVRLVERRVLRWLLVDDRTKRLLHAPTRTMSGIEQALSSSSMDNYSTLLAVLASERSQSHFSSHVLLQTLHHHGRVQSLPIHFRALGVSLTRALPALTRHLCRSATTRLSVTRSGGSLSMSTRCDNLQSSP